MRADLSTFQDSPWHDDGRLRAPDGSVFVRRSTKTNRKAADALVADGVPIVLYQYGAAQFEWFDGEDAREVWAHTRPHVVTTEPTAKQLAKHVMWTAGVWFTDDERQLLYLTGRC